MNISNISDTSIPIRQYAVVGFYHSTKEMNHEFSQSSLPNTVILHPIPATLDSSSLPPPFPLWVA